MRREKGQNRRNVKKEEEVKRRWRKKRRRKSRRDYFIPLILNYAQNGKKYN